MKAYLSTCLRRELDAGTAYSISQTLALTEPKFTWGINYDALIDRVRSQQATFFLNNPSLGDVLLFVDHDILFTARDAAQIVKDVYNGYDVCGAMYVTRSGTVPHPAVRLKPGQRIVFKPDAEPVEIVYASTGFVGIHRKVFEKLAQSLPVLRSGVDEIIPFFMPFAYQGEYLSEDWAFCQRARDAGFKIYLDPRIKLAHMGDRAYVLEDLQLSATDQIVTFTVREGQIDRTEIISDLAAYWNKTIEEVKNILNTVSGKQLLAREWNEKKPETPEEVENFYRATKNYIYDLAQFNLSPGYWWRIYPVRQLAGKRVVDFGGGIGTLSLALAEANREVTYVELPSEHRRFAEFRFKRHRANIQVADSLDGLTNQDAIVAIDTLEHIYPSRIEATARKMCEALRDGGVILEVSDFGYSDEHPMHYDTRSQWEKIFKDLGCIKISEGRYEKKGG